MSSFKDIQLNVVINREYCTSKMMIKNTYSTYIIMPYAKYLGTNLGTLVAQDRKGRESFVGYTDGDRAAESDR